jgi:exonuclease I
MRFGLREGDLSNFEGRAQLYHVLFKYRPRNIWMSPKCKAWCRWNQFNANRSAAMASQVMRARQEDEPHLLLCEAVFTLQSDRGPEFHFHLE